MGYVHTHLGTLAIEGWRSFFIKFKMMWNFAKTKENIEKIS
jgi:hypothetical protein